MGPMTLAVLLALVPSFGVLPARTALGIDSLTLYWRCPPHLMRKKRRPPVAVLPWGFSWPTPALGPGVQWCRETTWLSFGLARE